MTEMNTLISAAFEEWQEILTKARRRFYFLAYVHPEQLLALHHFVNGNQRGTNDVPFIRSIFTFINSASRTISLSQPSTSTTETMSLLDYLSAIGLYLDSVSSTLLRLSRVFYLNFLYIQTS